MRDVGAGSFIGGAARYMMTTFMSGIQKGWPTIAINLTDCFLIGLMWGFLSRTLSENSNIALFLMVGI